MFDVEKLDRKRLERIVETLGRIDSGERLTPKRLSEDYGVDRRTVYRDMRIISDTFSPLCFDKEEQRYRFVNPGYSLKRMDLSRDEVKVILAGKAILPKLGKGVADAFDGLVGRLNAESGKRTHSRMQTVTSNYWVDIDPVDDFSSIQNQFDAVQKAMDEKRTLKIKYNSMQRRERTEREIDPYCLFYSSGVWYVLAYCHLRSEVRMFALDCIEEIKATDSYYVIPSNFSTDDYFKAGWHIYRAGKPTEIKLRFTSEVARWVLRRKWHPSQKVEKNKDGSIVLTVTVDGTAEVRRWIYHWGPNCEVISPPEFRKEVEAELEAMIKVYRMQQG